jgi:hypothetical protein
MKRGTAALAGMTAIAALVLSGCTSKQAGSPGPAAAANPEINTLTLLAQRVSETSAAKQGAHLNISVEGSGQALGGEGDVRFGAKPAMDLKMAIPEMAEVTMRFVDDAFYVKLPEELEPGKSWLKIDTKGADPLSKALGSAVKQMKENGDPSQTLKLLEGAGEITGTKTESLNGKDTTHYTLTIDVKKLVAKQSDADQKKALEEATKAGVQNFPVDVWLDAENLPARIALNIPFTDPTSQKTEQVKMTIDYTDWGKPVDVTAPPAAEVAELPR